MDIFIADPGSAQAADLVKRLKADGHLVHGCRDATDVVPCAALRGTACPLDEYPVDVAVGIGPESDVDRLGDGEVCALRRRIPLVLLDRPQHPLGRWAAAVAPSSRALEVIRKVGTGILPEHSAEARRTVREELRIKDVDDTAAEVDVKRRSGGLLVELTVDERLSAPDAERLGVHVAQSVRRFDPWAKKIDVSVHSTN